MPITISAKKKLRRDTRKRVHNATKKSALKQAIKSARKSPTADQLKLVQKLSDKAAKKGLIHKNKAARIKSRLAKAALAAKKASK